MEDFLKPENVKLLSQLILPGFIIAYVRAQLLPNRRLSLKDAIIGYIALSFSYQTIIALFSAISGAFFLKIEMNGKSNFGLAASSIMVSIVIPAFLGLILGLDGRHGWTRSLLKRVGVHISHPVDTAWDWRFSNSTECWVMTVLKDGTKWAGHLSPGSFTSTDPNERDIFIEKVYSVDDNNIWTNLNSSVWIAHGEIQTLQFWPYVVQKVDTNPDEKSRGGRRWEKTTRVALSFLLVLKLGLSPSKWVPRRKRP